ncbi:MAG: bifunctional phosphopantothenoylcysteine decarboxylase/phosphopantothenate--cysteine ligase CoaBC [Christensenellales bacterium]|jgi:phosphopantothenoylcysteine decarboxylase/phosphopantothenate--cysteine ligase
MSAVGKTVVLGITGGIAAYKACEVASRLSKANCKVHVIMTRNACQFVQPLTLQTLSHNPVVVDTFETPRVWEVEHVSLARKADVLLIAPATANVIAKLAHGLADDMLTTTALATQAPLLLAPAMNAAMWQHPATQANLALLRQRGASTVGPEGGLLACGDIGTGRMSEPDEIVTACLRLLYPLKDLLGKKVLVTAGPTREAIDPVRFITNRSSGKMGYAIAQAALLRGAAVTLVSGPVRLAPLQGAEMVMVDSTGDLYDAVTRLAPGADLLIQAAAPADFKPRLFSEEKIKKQPDSRLCIDLVQTPDVAAAAGVNKRAGQVFVGFAAETHNHLDNARRKLDSKRLDLIALNDVSRTDAGFDADTNALTLISHQGTVELPLMSKLDAAHKLLDEAVLLMRGVKDA